MPTKVDLTPQVRDPRNGHLCLNTLPFTDRAPEEGPRRPPLRPGPGVRRLREALQDEAAVGTRPLLTEPVLNLAQKFMLLDYLLKAFMEEPRVDTRHGHHHSQRLIVVNIHRGSFLVEQHYPPPLP